LTLRQLAYGALDAQTSYFVAKALARPPAFHLRRIEARLCEQHHRRNQDSANAHRQILPFYAPRDVY